jgi:hypothetical protein
LTKLHLNLKAINKARGKRAGKRGRGAVVKTFFSGSLVVVVILF